MVASNPKTNTAPGPEARGDIAIAIVESYRRRVGGALISTKGGSGTGDTCNALMAASSVILCHDGAADPCFIFANHAAAAVWRMGVEELVGMPSRLSAPPELRAERAQALAQAATDGVLNGYSGERVAADGSRFMIVDATLWTVDLPNGGLGQAVLFDTWRAVPGPDGVERVR